jgi:trigger factor
MATATETQLDVEIKITETAPCTKRIAIKVPASEVDARLELALSAYLADAALPGFRKGKAPRALVEKRVGGALLNETRGQLMSEAYSKAIQDNKLTPISDPRPVDGETVPELARGKDFSFTVEIEVAPEFATPDFSTFEVKRPTIEVTKDHVDGEILRQSYRFGTPSRIDGPFDRRPRRNLLRDRQGSLRGSRGRRRRQGTAPRPHLRRPRQGAPRQEGRRHRHRQHDRCRRA